MTLWTILIKAFWTTITFQSSLSVHNIETKVCSISFFNLFGLLLVGTNTLLLDVGYLRIHLLTSAPMILRNLNYFVLVQI